MKKALICIMLISMCLFMSGCKNKENNRNNTSAVIKEEQRIAHTVSTATTESEETTFVITPLQSGEITIEASCSSGDIVIEVRDNVGTTDTRIDETMLDENVQKFVYPVNTGAGEYMVKIDTTNFVGSYDISWIVSAPETVNNRYTSEQGYHLNYNSSMFVTTQTEGHDKFVYSSNTENETAADPNIFVDISIIPAEEFESVKASYLTEDANPGICYLANSTLKGKYVLDEEDINGERVIKRTFIIDLDDGRGMVIATSYYDGFSSFGSVGEKRIDQMINSIVID